MWGPVLEVLDVLAALGSIPLPRGRRASRALLGLLVVAAVVGAVVLLSLAVRGRVW